MITVTTQTRLMNLVARYTTAEHGFSIYERSFLIAVAGRANHTHTGNDTWRCWPSIEQLCRDSCMGKTKIHETISLLVGKQVLEYEQGKKGVSNKYKINVESLGNVVGQQFRYGKVSYPSNGIDDFDEPLPF